MAKGKGRENQPNQEVKSREQEIADFRSLVEFMTAEAKTIKDDSDEMKKLLNKIRKLEKSIRELDQVKENNTKFIQKLADLNEQRSKLLAEVVDVQTGSADWQVQKKEMELQRQRSAESLELEKFNKFNAHYLEAQERLVGLVDFLKKYNLAGGKEESVSQLEKELGDIKVLLDNKAYLDLTNQFDKFKYKVDNLLSKAYDEKTEQEESASTTEPAKPAEPVEQTKPLAVKPTAAIPGQEVVPPTKLGDLKPKVSQRERKKEGMVAKKLVPSLGMGENKAPKANIDKMTDEQRQAAYESGLALHEENENKFLELVRSIKIFDAKLNKKGAFFRSFQKEMDILAVCLRNDDELNDKNEFDANIKLFSDTYARAKEKFEEELAKVETKSTAKKPAELEKSEPEAATAPTPENKPTVNKKEHDQRKRLCDDRWSGVMLLEKVIRDTDKEEKKNNKLVEHYQTRLEPVKDILKKAFANLDNAKDFNESIAGFTDLFDEVLSGLPSEVKTAFERGEAKKTALPPKNKIEKEPKEEEKRKLLLAELSKDLLNLENVINKKVKNKPEGYFDADIVKLKKYLENARQADLVKEFEDNIHNFEDLIFKTTAEVELAAAESKNLAKEQKMDVETETKPLPAAELKEASGEQPSVLPEPPAKKKGLWGRFKEGVRGIFNRDTGKIAGKMSYDTITSVLGIKLATDAVYGLATGKGDLAMWLKGRKESKQTIESMTAALKSITELSEKANKSQALDESVKTAKRLADFKAQVDSANILPEAKKALLDTLENIAAKNQEEGEKAKKERDEAVRRVMEVYEQNKISGLKIAKDAMNFALTATGFSMLRGIMYAGVSIAERVGKARKEYAKQDLKENSKKTELSFVAKDIIVNAARETAHGLSVGLFSKEQLGAKQRTINLIKSLGTVARGFGIYGLAFTHAELPGQSIDKLISGIKEQGIATTVSDNFIHNAEHILHLSVSDSAHKAPTAAEQSVTHEIPAAPEHHEVPDLAEAPAGFSVNQFALENKLSPELAHSFQNLVSQYPELNNPDSIQHILNASQVGGGVHSHHEIIKGTIDTLDEGGGERRQVIFEELLKKGGPESAANYLESQEFSSRHLSYLSKYVHKDTPEEYLKFAQEYDEKNNKMVSGLFRAMQGRESTDLANAGLEVDAVGGKPAIDNHVRGEVNYFGMENDQPVLSGSGSVTVDQMSEVAHSDVVTEPAPAPAKFTLTEHTSLANRTDGALAKPEMELMTDYPPSETKAIAPARVEKTLATYKASESAPVAVSFADAPINNLLAERGINPKEFIATFHSMGENMVARLNDSLVPSDGADKFLHEKFTHLSGLEEKYNNALKNGLKLSDADLQQIDKLLKVEHLYKNGKSNWEESLDKTLFSEDDERVMQLAFAPHKNPSLHPILTNNSHAARIWNSAEKKDVFWYEQDSTFNLDKNGNLVIKDSTGESVMNKKDVLNLAR